MVTLQDDMESREFLKAVEDSDGRAPTSEIRGRTNLSESQIQYRYGKLENMGLIEVERDASLTSEGEPPMKLAVLTDLAKEEIDKGLLVEADDDEYGRPDIEDLAEDVSEIQSELAEVRQQVHESGDGELGARVEDIEDRVTKIRGALNNDVIAGLRMLHESVASIEVALEDEGIDVTDVEVPKSKHKEMNRRLDESKEKQQNQSG